MTELLINEEVMKHLYEELITDIQLGPIKESDLSCLPYLHARPDESFRIHAPMPFLIPHRAISPCEVMNYTIPKDSRILVNVWAIGRAQTCGRIRYRSSWNVFLGSYFVFQGQLFEFLPFGSGKRQCPGIPLASKQVLLTLSSLVHIFGWSLENGEDPLKLDMYKKLGVTLRKEKPLLVVPIKK